MGAEKLVRIEKVSMMYYSPDGEISALEDISLNFAEV